MENYGMINGPQAGPKGLGEKPKIPAGIGNGKEVC